MRQLLWKEMHDLRGWLLAGAALTIGLELLLHYHVLGAGFVSEWLLVLMPQSAVIAAIGLAAGQVAGERRAGTLDFLLVRPASASAIVWSKFMAGVVVLSLLVAAAVALGYADPGGKPDGGIQIITERVSAWQLLVTLLPRFWLLYALSLFFSVLVDRAIKAAALAVVVVIACASVAILFAELAPFSGFVYWLPFFEGTLGLLEAARSPWLSAVTGLVYTCASVIAAAASAALLKRSPERYFGYRGLTVAAAVVIAAAVASVNAGANRLPVTAPVGALELQKAAARSTLLASGAIAAVIQDDNVRFLDFTQPSRPRQIADVTMPEWSTQGDWGVYCAVMDGGTVYLLGRNRQPAMRRAEIAIVTPAGLAGAIPLELVGPDDYVSIPVLAGGFVYVAVTQNRVGNLLTFDLASGRQVSSLLIRMRAEQPGPDEGSPHVRMARRGTFLYISSPSYLTAIDIASPARPVVTSQLHRRPGSSLLYATPRPLAWQGNRLFEIEILPGSLVSYDLGDPARPAARPKLTFHGSMTIGGSGQRLYQPWRAGVLEFHANSDGLEAQRYLRVNRDKATVSALAVEGQYVYVLTAADTHDRRAVHAFRVGL